MAAYERRHFAGGAVATTLSGAINGSATSISIASATGWPSGSVGPFGVVIDRGTATEEKVLIASRSGTTLTVASGGRGVDGTSGVSHDSGATIELAIFSRDLDEANAHIADTALDHHTQYLNTARHDVEARHAFGAALGTPAAPAAVGTTAATGTGDNPAREDHVHEIGAGAIDSASMFAAGVVDAAALAADSVGSSELANNAVDTAAIADDAVTNAKIADGAIDAAAKFGAGVVDAAAIAANAVGSSELADGAVDTAAISDAVVTMAKLASEAGTSYTPTLTGVTLGTGGTRYGRYFKFGRLVVGVAGFTLGTGGNVTATIEISIPFTCASGTARWIMAARAVQSSPVSRASGLGVIEPGEAVGKNFATFGAGAWDDDAPFDWAASDDFLCVFLFEAAT